MTACIAVADNTCYRKRRLREGIDGTNQLSPLHQTRFPSVLHLKLLLQQPRIESVLAFHNGWELLFPS